VFTTGSPTQPFVDAVRIALAADATLGALVTGIYGHLSEAARTAYPYVVLGRRGRLNDSGAMQTAGGHVNLQVDIWSDHKGPSEVHDIQARIALLLERTDLTIAGFDLVLGSVSCEFEDVFDEPDTDKPDARLYHGVQRWIAEIHESS
jgi:hypothetical protein